MISYQILKKMRRTQVNLIKGAYTQASGTKSVYMGAVILFMGCVPPDPYFKEENKSTWGFLMFY